MELYATIDEIKLKQDAVIGILKEKRIITNPQEIIYDNADVLQLLKISQRTLANWRASGIITYSKIGGRLFYTQADIDECMKRNRFKSFNYGK